MVAAPNNGFCPGALFLPVEDLTGHYLHAVDFLPDITASNSAHAFAIVVHSSDGACHVSAVVTGIDGECAGCKVVPETVVSFLLFVDPHVVGKILVVEIYALVHDTHDNVGAAGLVVLPNREHVYIATTYRR